MCGSTALLQRRQFPMAKIRILISGKMKNEKTLKRGALPMQESPSSISVPNLKLIVQVVQKILRGSRN